MLLVSDYSWLELDSLLPNLLEQQSPIFLAPGTSFVEDNFCTDWDGKGDGFGMI